MRRLIEKYRSMPSPSNRAKLQAYLDNHPLALAVANDEELAFLKTHSFRI